MKRIALASLFVLVLVLGMVARSAVSQAEQTKALPNCTSCKTCGKSLSAILQEVNSWEKRNVDISKYSDIKELIKVAQEQGYKVYEDGVTMYITNEMIKAIYVPLIPAENEKGIENSTISTVAIIKILMPRRVVQVPIINKEIAVGYEELPAQLYKMSIHVNRESNIAKFTLERAFYDKSALKTQSSSITYDLNTKEIISTSSGSSGTIGIQSEIGEIACDVLCHLLIAMGVYGCCALYPPACPVCIAVYLALEESGQLTYAFCFTTCASLTG